MINEYNTVATIEDVNHINDSIELATLLAARPADFNAYFDFSESAHTDSLFTNAYIELGFARIIEDTQTTKRTQDIVNDPYRALLRSRRLA